MSHNHNHSCVCEHANLKFCKSCQKPYCLDCHQEWNQYLYQYYPSGYTQYLYYINSVTGAINSYKTPSYNQTISTAENLTSTATPCNHVS